jgi:hypothetical protein
MVSALDTAIRGLVSQTAFAEGTKANIEKTGY